MQQGRKIKDCKIGVLVNTTKNIGGRCWNEEWGRGNDRSWEGIRFAGAYEPYR
jgi:hypothetical protein